MRGAEITFRYPVRALLLLIILVGNYQDIKPQLSPIGKGWAQNSINAVIFRRNSLVYFRGKQYTAYYDSTGTVIIAKRNYGENKWAVHHTQYTGNIKDAHCSISIMVDGDGYLHVAWGQHNNPLNYCTSSSPGAITLSDKTKMTGIQEETVSYPEFYNLPNGDLLFMYRQGQSGNGNLIINRYSTAEKKWNRLQTNLIDGENQRNAYWQTFIDNKGVIHISWVWRETWDVATNHDLCYARSTDGGITWQKSNGKLYQLPITLSTAEVACKIPMGSELINQTSMCADSKSNPYIASYWRLDSVSIPQYQLVYRDKGIWRGKQISTRTTDFSLSGGGTKKIPISRPQLVVTDNQDSIRVYMIYRDAERGNKISINYCNTISDSIWHVSDITDFPVDSWEPTYDTELWRSKNILSLFVQRVGQGDSEALEDRQSQPVYILDITSIPNANETVEIRNFD